MIAGGCSGIGHAYVLGESEKYLEVVSAEYGSF
jgi:hypothetical protein